MSSLSFSIPDTQVLVAKLGGREQLVVQSREKLAGLDPASGSVLWESAIPSFRGMNILTPVVYRDGVFTSTCGGRSLRLRITGENGAFQASEVWSQNEQGYMSTPVVIVDHAYHHLRSQRRGNLGAPGGRRQRPVHPRFEGPCSLELEVTTGGTPS
ncbi:MAG: PQQ-binding-like beta-propeller repeat protein [Verrucomicrobiales bacterium]